MSINVYKAKGFSLLEVMIAVFVLGIGLLGLAHLQVTTLKHNESAYSRSQASILASDIFDRMRANQTAARAGDYNLAADDDPPITPNTIAEMDIAEWLSNLDTFLPSGDGSISCDPCTAGSLFIVTVQWVEAQDNGSRGISTFDYVGAL